jgi:hypothetical protein
VIDSRFFPLISIVAILGLGTVTVAAQGGASPALPDCSGPQAVIVPPGTNLEVLNTDLSHSVFCLRKGTYPGFNLTRSGSPAQPLTLRSAPNASPEQVVVSGVIQFLGADFWTLAAFTVDSPAERLVRFKDGADHNTLTNLTLQHGRTLVSFLGGDFNTLQHSILRDTRRVPFQDSTCLVHYRNSRFNAILDNEFVNCAGDAIQTIETGHGLLIEGNEFYLTPALHSDCQGNLDPTGVCICAENALDVKAAADLADPAGTLIFRHNLAYGFNGRIDPSCGGSSSGQAPEPAINIHQNGLPGSQPATFVLVENNLIFDSLVAVRYPKSSPQFITIRNNLFYGFSEAGILLGATPLRQEVYHNTFVAAAPDVPWLAWPKDKTIELTDVRNNLIINSAPPSPENWSSAGSPFIENNAYFYLNANPAQNERGAEVEYRYDARQFGDYCFTVHKHTAARVRCLANVLPLKASPVIDAGDRQLGNRSGLGIDDAIGIATDLTGLRRDSWPDTGAFEYRAGKATIGSLQLAGVGPRYLPYPNLMRNVPERP